MNEITAELRNAKCLIGATILCLLRERPSEANRHTGSFGFSVECEDKTVRDVWIDRDPEGNGPGHLDIVERTLKLKP